jgi:hypothetical protein
MWSRSNQLCIGNFVLVREERRCDSLSMARRRSPVASSAFFMLVQVLRFSASTMWTPFSQPIRTKLVTTAAAFAPSLSAKARRLQLHRLSSTTEAGTDSKTSEDLETSTASLPSYYTMDTMVSLCKRRGIIYPSSEIYNGYAGFYDYGPIGVELKRNIKQVWWQTFVQARADIVGLDTSIIHHPTTWKSSGRSSCSQLVCNP